MSKWDEKYSNKADVFSSTENWKKEVSLAIKKANIQPNDNVLDLGCNSGKLMVYLAEEMHLGGVTYFGVDPNVCGLEKLLERPERKQFCHVCVQPSLDGFKDYEGELFDKVFFIHAINQVEDIEQLLLDLWKKTKKGGEVIVITHNPYWGHIKQALSFYKAYKPDTTMVRNPTLDQMKTMFYEHGFQFVEGEYFDSIESVKKDWLAKLIGNRVYLKVRKPL